jgi:hypothetical protein
VVPAKSERPVKEETNVVKKGATRNEELRRRKKRGAEGIRNDLLNQKVRK